MAELNKIEYIGPSKLLDSEMNLLNTIFEIIQYSDPGYSVKINRKEDEIACHITPSNPDFRQDIISNLLYINRVLKIKIKYSSSLKISKMVSFSISLEKSPEIVSL